MHRDRFHLEQRRIINCILTFGDMIQGEDVGRLHGAIDDGES